jgi:hypothetical protein
MKDIALLALIDGINSITNFCLYPRKDIKEAMTGLSSLEGFNSVLSKAEMEI